MQHFLTGRPDGTSDERATRDGNEGRATNWLVKGLGLFSIGLGAAEVVVPGSLARMIAVRSNGMTEPLTRMVGMREIAAGLGILASRQPTNWLEPRPL